MGRNITRRTVVQTLGAAGAIGVLGGVSSAQEDENGNGDNDDDEERPAEDTDVETIAADPTDIPDPVDWDDPQRHEIDIHTEELVAEIEDGVTYDFMTFGGEIPGPFIHA